MDETEEVGSEVGLMAAVDSVVESQGAAETVLGTGEEVDREEEATAEEYEEAVAMDGVCTVVVRLVVVEMATV